MWLCEPIQSKRKLRVTHMCKLLISAILFLYVVKAMSFNPLLPALLPTPRYYISMIKSADAAEPLAKDFKVITRLFWKQLNFGNEV